MIGSHLQHRRSGMSIFFGNGRFQSHVGHLPMIDDVLHVFTQIKRTILSICGYILYFVLFFFNSMWVLIYIYMCVYVCMYVCMYVCAYTYIHTHTYIYIYTRTFLFTFLESSWPPYFNGIDQKKCWVQHPTWRVIWVQLSWEEDLSQ